MGLFKDDEKKQLLEQISLLQKKNAALISQCNDWQQKNAALSQQCELFRTKNAGLVQQQRELSRKCEELEAKLADAQKAAPVSTEPRFSVSISGGNNNQRDGKGTNSRDCVSDYTVIDLETTSKNVNACEVIEMAAVRIRGGEIAESFSTLVKPSRKIPAMITKITGISDDMVADAPCCRDALQKYLDFIGDDIIVGHNILSYDSNILYDLYLQHFGVLFGNDMVDTLQFARYCDLPLSDLKLTTLTEYFGIEHDQAHRALADCIANYHCYEKLKPLLTGKPHHQNSSSLSRRYGAKPCRTTQDLLELLRMIKSITADNVLSDSEIMLLGLWLDAHRELEGNYPYDVIVRKLVEILEDRIITEDERAELLALLEEQADPVRHRSEECNDRIDFKDKLVCLTGEFEYGCRTDVEQLLEKFGALIAKSVTGKTDYLIVGGCGSAAWSCGNYGNKVKKALELQEKGKPIQIIREDVALKCLIMQN